MCEKRNRAGERILDIERKESLDTERDRKRANERNCQTQIEANGQRQHPPPA